jgi:hypothetical protein
MAEPKKDFLTVDDLHLLMQGYKNTVELSNSVLKQQQDIITCVKEINIELSNLKDITYDTAGKTQEKVESCTLRNVDKIENVLNKLETSTISFKKDIADQNQLLLLNKEEVLNKVNKTQFTVWVGILGLVGIIGSLLSYMYVFVHDHKELMIMIKLVAQKLNIVIQ